MKINVYSVLDTKTGVFGNIVLDIRRESVIRAFADKVNMREGMNMWFKHPEDFALYEIGVFDDETGMLEGKKLECLVTASAVKTIVTSDFVENGKKDESQLELKIN